jgi:O-6-methylguanine DNA methyltransferase
MRLGHVEARGGGLVVHAWGGDAGLAAVHLGEVPEEAALRGRFPVRGVEVGEPDARLAALGEAIRRYLAAGGPLEWTGALDLRGVSPFQREVFDAVRAIPYAEVRTYGQVARLVGRPRAVRAVGNALHGNPFPLVVPCHRVLREGGALGGFACGVEAKRRLLALEAGQTELPWGDAPAAARPAARRPPEGGE